MSDPKTALRGEARLDAAIERSNRRQEALERYGAVCLDCVVGEPHVCPVIWKGEQAKQKRLLSHLQEHLEIDAMLKEAASGEKRS